MWEGVALAGARVVRPPRRLQRLWRPPPRHPAPRPRRKTRRPRLSLFNGDTLRVERARVEFDRSAFLP